MNNISFPIKVLLISAVVSLLPVAGWAFDFPLFVYSLTQRKYTLAMMTVLNWFIWGFWLMFGMNVNMGPTLKSSYLGNQENVVKKALLFPHKEPSKVLYPSTHVQVKEIDGTNYLVDANNNEADDVAYEEVTAEEDEEFLGTCDGGRCRKGMQKRRMKPQRRYRKTLFPRSPFFNSLAKFLHAGSSRMCP